MLISNLWGRAARPTGRRIDVASATADTHIYIYIYRERERDAYTHKYVYIYIYIHISIMIIIIAVLGQEKSTYTQTTRHLVLWTSSVFLALSTELIFRCPKQLALELFTFLRICPAVDYALYAVNSNS